MSRGRTATIGEQAARRALSRAAVESMLAAAFGAPPTDLHDLEVELTLIEQQSDLVAALEAAPDDHVFGAEDVELFLDALEEFADCDIAGVLGVDWLDEDGAPPSLTSDQLASIIARCGFASRLSPVEVVSAVESGLAHERGRLRRAIATWRRNESAGLTAIAGGSRVGR